MAKTSIASCAVTFLALAACVHGLIPDALQCAEGLIEVGLEELTNILTPCAFGPGDTCCNGINPIFKLASGGFAEGCLCDELLLEELTKEITGNELAVSFGFTGEALLTT
ncbi:hypothetical protein BSKO_06126 [Bryopsis sp. KO-2023]|nr:hypothetical protein BSKO_06126 [Bryopsis sp. KO-2023]